MSTTTTKLKLGEALDIAKEFIDLIKPYCERVQVAGSIRRRKADVGDIEIVCIPAKQMDLFGDPGTSLLTPHLDTLVKDGLLVRSGRNGERYKSFWFKRSKIDLFITAPEQWPVIYAIRTGSADFSRRLVTQKQKGGLLPSHLRVADGYVWDGGTPLKLFSEREFLELCGGWVEPWHRY